MRIGIIGGGQLSRMLALAGLKLGLQFIFYVKEAQLTVHGLGEQVIGDYEDKDALKQFCDRVDIITYENETIPPSLIMGLCRHQMVYPDVSALTIMQDRLLEKKFFQALNIPTTQFTEVESLTDILNNTNDTFPFLIKKRRNGYDGRGQAVIKSKQQLTALPSHFLEDTIIENHIDFDREVSIIGARDHRGECRYYDLCENTHRDGILIETVNRHHDPQFEKAKTYLSRILEHLDYVGVCALELFQLGDQLIANEMAPRVHNTGHWTIEGAVTSQFENHLRAITGLPLGDTTSRGSFKMMNLLSTMPSKEQLLKHTRVHLHDYLKTPAPSRKLGHITLETAHEATLDGIYHMLHSENDVSITR